MKMTQLLILIKMKTILMINLKFIIMRTQFITVLFFAVSIFSFAQKKELKAVEKALKSNNYTQAKSLIGQVEPMLSGMDDKSKAKYYYLNAQALYANGTGTNSDVSLALDNLNNATGFYVSEITELKKSMETAYLSKTNDYYKSSNFEDATKGFEILYNITPNDTIYLYYAASSAVSAKNYDSALIHYNKLRTLNYTGVKKQYYATNVKTGEEETFDKVTRDFYVKSGDYIKPTERKSESKVGEITKNIALILSSQGKTDEALIAIKDARKSNPDNVDLIINEANLYLELKDEEKFKSLLEEALEQQPNNDNLHYNIGVISMKNNEIKKARSSFEKVLEINPSYADAALNLSTSYIDEGNSLIEEMNALGSSAADDKKYDELKALKSSHFQTGADLLIEFLDKNPEGNVKILEQLKNIYNALGDSDKAKEISDRLNSLGN